jgi:hypothetical protein
MKKIAVAFFGLIVFNSIYSQTLNVQGSIIAGTTPVKFASVTFIDQSDTVKKFMTITDTLGNYHVSVLTTVDNKRFVLPSTVELSQNYPNPFSSSTAITYQLNKQSDVSIKIYDILGREVKAFKIGFQAIGTYGIVWDGKDHFGSRLALGIYFYKLQAGKETQVKKMLFGLGSTNISLPIPKTVPSYVIELMKENKAQLAAGIFTAQITNTDSTTPPVTGQAFSNINIHSDTTLNFQLNEANDFVLCYVKSYNNSWEIFLNNIKGTHPKYISNYAGDDEYPQWSPDGRYIVYSHNGMLVAVYDVQNQSNTILTSDTMQAGQTPFWTPNGKICFAYRGPYWTSPWGIYIMDPDGSNIREIKINPSLYGVSLFYQDSYTCLYVDSNKVYKTNIDSTFNEFVLDLQPAQGQSIGIADFNPVADELLVGTNITPDSSEAIAKYNVETKQLNVLLTADEGYILGGQRYSKDFSKIIFNEINTNGYNEEYLSILENGAKRRLIRLPGQVGGEWFDYNPMRFSPDGKYVAFSKNVGTVLAWISYLYVVDVTTGALQYIDMGFAPSWNPIKPQLYRRK